MVTPEQKAYIIETLQARVPGLRAVYLFGSRVMQEGRYVTAKSDWDIAYLAGFVPAIGGWDKLVLQGEMARELGSEWIDLIDIGVEKSPILLENVLEGRRLWVVDAVEVERWELGRLGVARDFRFRHREQWAQEIADIRARVDHYRKAKGLQPRKISHPG